METLDTMTATHECGFSGTLAALALHDCDIFQNGGRCEDYPCCGHTDGDGCQTLPSHTAEFYHRNPMLMYEPGSPEWQDALADLTDDDPEWFCKGCGTDYDHPGGWEVFDNGDNIDLFCVSCRVRNFINSTGRR